jgi:hypothetical protein
VGEFGVCADYFGFGAEEAAFVVWEGGGGVYVVRVCCNSEAVR